MPLQGSERVLPLPHPLHSFVPPPRHPLHITVFDATSPLVVPDCFWLIVTFARTSHERF
jgi:hypothetical protein